MPILYKGKGGDLKLSPRKFESEHELKSIVESNPDLVLTEDEPQAVVVARNLPVPEAGEIHLLLINSEGLFMIVEAVMGGEGEGGVMSSVLNKAAAICEFTADELDDELDGVLRKAVDSFHRSLNDYFAIQRRWEALNTFLFDRNIRIVIATTDPSPELVRVAEFLDESADFDLRLVSLKKYSLQEQEDILIPEIIVGGESFLEYPGSRFLAALDAYSIVAAAGFRPEGADFCERKISPTGWNGSAFYALRDLGRGELAVGLYLKQDNENLKEALENSRSVIENDIKWGDIRWQPQWNGGAAKMEIVFDDSTSSMGVAKALKILVDQTRDKINQVMG